MGDYYDWELRECGRLMRNGATKDEIVEYLNDSGISLPDASALVARLCDLTPERAIEIVSKHPDYRATAERNQRLREQLRGAQSIEEEVLLLIGSYSPDGSLPRGASDEEIDACFERLGMEAPQELRAWLRVCNGSLAGPGGFRGIHQSRESMSIEAHLAWYPLWRTRGWIPIAGDGCGSDYVLASASRTRSGHPILFLDWERSGDELKDTASYVAASNLWTFLRLLLLQEMEMLDWHWPFDKEHTLAEDPAIVDCTEAPLPWDTD